MSQQRISLNPDLKRLRDEGYHVYIEKGCLVVDDVPYVTSTKEIKRAALISSLCLAGEKTHRPDTHVVKFTGEHPCSKTGYPLNIAR